MSSAKPNSNEAKALREAEMAAKKAEREAAMAAKKAAAAENVRSSIKSVALCVENVFKCPNLKLFDTACC